MKIPFPANTKRCAHRIMVLLLSGLLGLSLFQAVGVGAADPPLSDGALAAALQRGGYVILFRHAMTDQSQQDTDLQNITNCATQRNLADEGRTQARTIGGASETLAIPVGQVVSSDLCCALDTVRLVTGKAPEPTERIRDNTPGKVAEATMAERNVALRQILTSPQPVGTNRVVVSHMPNILSVTGVQLNEGDALVLAPDGSGDVRVVARLSVADWDTLAHIVTRLGP